MGGFEPNVGLEPGEEDVQDTAGEIIWQFFLFFFLVSTLDSELIHDFSRRLRKRFVSCFKT